MDHTHYARWHSIHLRDMVDLAKTHSDVPAKFNAAHFRAKKKRHVFSAMTRDQAHQQKNAYVKDDVESKCSSTLDVCWL